MYNVSGMNDEIDDGMDDEIDSGMDDEMNENNQTKPNQTKSNQTKPNQTKTTLIEAMDTWRRKENEQKIEQKFELKKECANNEIIISEDDRNIIVHYYENIVFEGGGMKGIAFGGALKCMEDYGLMQKIKRYAGSSAGAIVAALIAVGYTGDEIIKLMSDTDFTQFKDDSWGVVLDVYRFVHNYGIYKGDRFLEWFKGLVKDKTGNENYNFKQLYDDHNKELVLTGTCLNKANTYYFHYKKWPEMPIALAVRISMSIPLVYKAIKLHTKTPKLDDTGTPVYDCHGNMEYIDSEDIMVDGGLLNNYPIWCFDGPEIGDHNVATDDMDSSKTIGFKLMSTNEKKDNQLYYYDSPIGNIVDYVKALIDSMTIQIERGHIRKGYWDKTVCLNTGNVHTLDFNLSEETKKTLIDNAYVATKNHFYCKLRGLPNRMNELN